VGRLGMGGTKLSEKNARVLQNRGGPSADAKISELDRIYSFSIPLTGEKYSLVKVSSSTHNNWAMSLVVLQLTDEGNWEVVAKRSIFTT